jgi:hypothetical protein
MDAPVDLLIRASPNPDTIVEGTAQRVAAAPIRLQSDG